MKTWIHFIGRKYYPTIATFEAEARTHGITRRIALATLERMSFGDRVLLAMQDGKSSLIFGEFIVTTISGVNLHFAQAAGLTITNQGGAKVTRGCGSYVTGPTFSLPDTLSLRTVAKDLLAAKDGSKPMVGGRYVESGIGPIRMRNLPFAQGFRPFDYEAWMAALTATGYKVPRLGMKPSLFYVDSAYVEPTLNTPNDFVIMGSAVQAVEAYSSK